MLANAKRKYALADYTVEYRPGKGWYFGRQLEKAHEFKGPYKSVPSVTLMIARAFRREIERRDAPYSLPE